VEDTSLALPLPQVELTQRTGVFNSRCSLSIEGEWRVISVGGIPTFQYGADDKVSEAYAMVFVVESGFATQAEAARVFLCSERTVRRNQRRYEDGGMEALAPRSGWKPGRRRLAGKRRREIERMCRDGISNREIARRLGVTENAIRKQAVPKVDGKQLLLFPSSKTETEMTGEDATQILSSTSQPLMREEIANTCEVSESPLEDELSLSSLKKAPDAAASPRQSFAADSWRSGARNRFLDRIFAYLGKLDDAVPLFEDTDGVQGAGVLFALPSLVSGGVFRAADKLYQNIGPAFYGLRTTMLVLLFMALWRIKRPEGLKEKDPSTLGITLGLDRAPEVKTVRRKLTSLAARGKAEELGRMLAKMRAEERGDLLGFLYVDGHVRAYHGKRDIPKAYVARRHLAMPAVTDYWIGDAKGDPLLVVTEEANEGLTHALPDLLSEAKSFLKDRPATVIFDRGGFSFEVFHKIIEEGFHFITYRKGKSPPIDEDRFSLHKAIINGRAVEYLLFDETVHFQNGKLCLRQITRLCSDGHQTHVITDRFDLSAVEVAFRMFERWRQENFFKYLREELALDALADYQVEPGDPTRTVPNPKQKELGKQIKAVREEIKSLECTLGENLIESSNRPFIEEFASLHNDTAPKIEAAKQSLGALLAERRQTPSRVEVKDISQAAVIKLAYEKKHLVDIIKMVAYQAESELFALTGKSYRRADDEGRTLLHEIFNAKADLRVKNNELAITLHPLSAPHRTEAVQKMCQTLSDTETCFPGTQLRLRFAVHPPPRIGLAFPGPRCPRRAPKPDISF
jgi:transposase